LAAALARRFASRNLQMTDNNLKQADVLAGAVVLKNGRGSAPGQLLRTRFNGRTGVVLLLPGPPHELSAMFESECITALREIAPQRHLATRVLKIAMIAESQADHRAAPI